MNSKKDLLNQIEINQQRLEHALRVHDADLMARMQRVLTYLHDELYQSIRDAVFPGATLPRGRRQPTDLKLVYSDRTPDGALMSFEDYAEFYRTLSRAERETLTTVDVDAEMVADLETALKGA